MSGHEGLKTERNISYNPLCEQLQVQSFTRKAQWLHENYPTSILSQSYNKFHQGFTLRIYS